MCNNGVEYGISVNSASVILRIFTDNYFLCLSKAMDQGERRFLKQTISSIETIKSGQQGQAVQPKKSSVWGKL